MSTMSITAGCWVFTGSVIFISIIFELIFSIIGLCHKRNECSEDSFHMDTWFTVYTCLVFGLLFVYFLEIFQEYLKKDFTDSFGKIYLSNLIHFALLGSSVYSLVYLGRDFDFLKECDGFSLMVCFSASIISLISGTFILISKTFLVIYSRKLDDLNQEPGLLQTFL